VKHGGESRASLFIRARGFYTTPQCQPRAPVKRATLDLTQQEVGMEKRKARTPQLMDRGTASGDTTKDGGGGAP